MKTIFHKLIAFVLLSFTIVADGKDNEYNIDNTLPSIDDVCIAMDDINFMKYCYENFDINKDGKVSPTEANAVQEINIENMRVYSLKGIEYFLNLKSLDCFHNKLTSLDISKNIMLKTLICGANELTSLDVTNNTELTEVLCFGNKITTLNLSRNTKLTHLYCDSNRLSAIALNNIFETLHNNNPDRNNPYLRKTIFIRNNSGTNSCNQSIATNKGWYVDTSSDLYSYWLQTLDLRK